MRYKGEWRSYVTQILWSAGIYAFYWRQVLSGSIHQFNLFAGEKRGKPPKIFLTCPSSRMHPCHMKWETKQPVRKPLRHFPKQNWTFQNNHTMHIQYISAKSLTKTCYLCLPLQTASLIFTCRVRAVPMSLMLCNGSGACPFTPCRTYPDIVVRSALPLRVFRWTDWQEGVPCKIGYCFGCFAELNQIHSRGSSSAGTREPQISTIVFARENGTQAFFVSYTLQFSWWRSDFFLHSGLLNFPSRLQMASFCVLALLRYDVHEIMARHSQRKCSLFHVANP